MCGVTCRVRSMRPLPGFLALEQSECTFKFEFRVGESSFSSPRSGKGAERQFPASVRRRTEHHAMMTGEKEKMIYSTFSCYRCWIQQKVHDFCFALLVLRPRRFAFKSFFKKSSDRSVNLFLFLLLLFTDAHLLPRTKNSCVPLPPPPSLTPPTDLFFCIFGVIEMRRFFPSSPNYSHKEATDNRGLSIG